MPSPIHVTIPQGLHPMHPLTIATVTTLLAAACVSTAVAQAPVTGATIASKAKATALDHAHAVTVRKNGGSATFTPASTRELHSLTHLAAGVVLGTLQTSVGAGTAGALPPGTYHVFLIKHGGSWHAYAETNGKIVAKATHVSVETVDAKQSGGKSAAFRVSSAHGMRPAARMNWASLPLRVSNANVVLAISVTFTGLPTLVVYESGEESEVQT